MAGCDSNSWDRLQRWLWFSTSGRARRPHGSRPSHRSSSRPPSVQPLGAEQAVVTAGQGRLRARGHFCLCGSRRGTDTQNTFVGLTYKAGWVVERSCRVSASVSENSRMDSPAGHRR